MPRTTIALPAAAVVCAALLAACGSSGSGSAATETATVPAGTLGDSPALRADQGAYTGMTADGRAITFTVKGDQVLNFTIGSQVFTASMPMGLSPPSLYYNRKEDVVTATWQTAERVAGALKEQEPDGRKARTTWTAATS